MTGFEWGKFFSGFKRPIIALLGGLLAHYVGVDSVAAETIAAVVFERAVSTGLWLYQVKFAK